MPSSTLRIRIASGQAELEIEGARDEVVSMLDQFETLVDTITSCKPHPAHSLEPKSSAPRRQLPPAVSPGDGEFGEYLHSFRSDLTGVDRALIAAHFVQSQSDDRSSATRDVNMALLEQGIKLPNPSVALRRNVQARHMFATTRGRFRVSNEGERHLESLKSQVEQ